MLLKAEIYDSGLKKTILNQNNLVYLYTLVYSKCNRRHNRIIIGSCWQKSKICKKKTDKHY